jgi:hypothetical protein
MSDFFTWLSASSPAATILLVAFSVAVVVAVLIYVVSFLQGREVSFWPPKIGPKLGGSKSGEIKTDRVPGMEGEWLQVLDGFKDRPYSIGRLTYSKCSGEYTFDGTNYHADGSQVCTWDSIHVHIDLKNRIISYIFRASTVGELHSSSYGFGIMNLKENESGELMPVDGHFIDSQVNASPQSFTLKRLDEIERTSRVKKTQDVCAYYCSLVREYHISRYERTRKN